MEIESGYQDYAEDEKYVLYDLKAMKRFEEYEKTKTRQEIVTKGRVEFRNVSAKYESDQDLVLKGLNFTIEGG